MKKSKKSVAFNIDIFDSEMKMKLLDKTDGNEYIIEYSQSVRMGVPGGSQESVCGFY